MLISVSQEEPKYSNIIVVKTRMNLEIHLLSHNYTFAVGTSFPVLF